MTPDFISDLRAKANAADLSSIKVLVEPDVLIGLLDELEKLRAALEGLCSVMEHCSVTSGVCGCGEDMHNHSEMSGHSPTDYGSYVADNAYRAARAILTPEASS